jgi:hypothetical protein
LYQERLPIGYVNNVKDMQDKQGFCDPGEKRVMIIILIENDKIVLPSYQHLITPIITEIDRSVREIKKERTLILGCKLTYGMSINPTPFYPDKYSRQLPRH